MKKQLGANIIPQYNIYNERFKHYKVTMIIREDVLEEMKKTISFMDYRILYVESKTWGKTLP